VKERDLEVSDRTQDPPVVAEPVEPAQAADPGAVTVGQLLDGAKSAVSTVADSARRLIDRGRYRKVRISRKGKPVFPDIPVAAVAVMEAASIATGGLARVLAVNLGAKMFLDINVVNEADKYLERGKQALLDGDLARAEEALVMAGRMDDRHAEVYLELGVLFRLKGQLDDARSFLLRAKELDALGDTGRRAEAILSAIEGKAR
jgi:tetratricopeptide (TPR) repeat protein